MFAEVDQVEDVLPEAGAPEADACPEGVDYSFPVGTKFKEIYISVGPGG